MDHIYWSIVPVSLGLGLAAGWVMHRSDFCMTAMFRDLFLFRDAFMLRMLLLVVVASMVLFEALRWAGLAQPYPFPLLGAPSLANILGGALFGVGMVLAGGCVVGTLYKMGAGSLLSALAFVGLLIGATAYGAIHEWWAAFVRATTVLEGRVTVPAAMAVSPALLLVPAVAGGGFLLHRWRREGLLRRPGFAEGYLATWKAALALALIGALSYALVGMPLGVTTSYSKLGAALVQPFAPAWVAASSYFQAVPLDYVPPLGHQAVRGGPGPGLDGIAAVQLPLVLGIVVGAAVSAALLRELCPRASTPRRCAEASSSAWRPAWFPPATSGTCGAGCRCSPSRACCSWPA